MRPTRRYFLIFTHLPTGQTIKTIALGTTACNAKNHGFTQLEQILKIDGDLPRQPGWTLTRQEDHGIYGAPV